MSEVERVLLPLDLSLDLPELTVTTRNIFDRSNVEITMLNAIEEPSCSGRGRDVERSTAQMDFLASTQFKFAQVSSCVQRGRAADCVLDYASRKPIDVIVMAPGTCESLRRNCLGHVTEQVLTQAQCAIWMEWMTGKLKYLRNVFCAVRAGGFYGQVFSRITAVAGLFGAEIRTVQAHNLKTDLPLGPAEPPVRATEGASDAVPVDTALKSKMSRADAGVLVTEGLGETVVAAMRSRPVMRLGSESESAVVWSPEMKTDTCVRPNSFSSARRHTSENADYSMR